MQYTTIVILRSGRVVDLGAGESIPPATRMKKTDPPPDPAVDAFTIPCAQVADLRSKKPHPR